MHSQQNIKKYNHTYIHMKFVCNNKPTPADSYLTIRELIAAIPIQEFQCLKSNKFKTTNRVIIKMTNTNLRFSHKK